MQSPAVSLLGFLILLPMVSLAAWGALGYWPRFRTRGALLRVSEVVALALGLTIFLGRRPPAEAIAMPPLPAPTIVVPGKASTQPVHSKHLPATIMDVDGRSFLVAELPVAASTQSVNVKLSTTAPAAAAAPASALGPTYTDQANGFAMRFPTGWSVKSFDDGDPWVLDATDSRGGLMSVGFSKFPGNVTADQIKLDLMAKAIKAQAQTTFETQGYARIDGRKSVWSRSTGPVPMTTKFHPRMTRMHYLVPLADGRALELRLAATPDQFEKLVPLMRQSAATLKILPRDAARKGATASAELK